jgi:hypothetical protein
MRFYKVLFILFFIGVFYFAVAAEFPFDTILTGLAKVLPDNSITPVKDTTIIISRYGLKFYFGHLLTNPFCCPQDVREDFFIKTGNEPYLFSNIIYPNEYPADIPLMVGGWYPPCTGSDCTSTSFINVTESYKTHEYRFPLGTDTLYMKVIEVYTTDSLKVRFDTVSFLTPSNIRNMSISIKSGTRVNLIWEKGYVTVGGIPVGENCKIYLYDFAGKKLFESSSKVSRKFAVINSYSEGIYIIRV